MNIPILDEACPMLPGTFRGGSPELTSPEWREFLVDEQRHMMALKARAESAERKYDALIERLAELRDLKRKRPMTLPYNSDGVITEQLIQESITESTNRAMLFAEKADKLFRDLFTEEQDAAAGLSWLSEEDGE